MSRSRVGKTRDPTPPARAGSLVVVVAVVVMPARAVHVAVRQLFLGGFPHLGHLDREIEVLASQRVDVAEPGT